MIASHEFWNLRPFYNGFAQVQTKDGSRLHRSFRQICLGDPINAMKQRPSKDRYETRLRDNASLISAVSGKPDTDLLPLGEESWLKGRILGVANVDQINADQAKTLPWVQTNMLPQRQCDACQFLARRRRRDV